MAFYDYRLNISLFDISLISSIGTWKAQAKNHKINNPNFLNY